MTNLVITGQSTSLRFIAVQKYQALGRERLVAKEAEQPLVVARLDAQMQRVNTFIKSRTKPQ